ncbi:MAG: hypothetical protein M3Z03_00725, partial [Actinomycetota bacterium]|nr:hypothetical protein [Actinomycetota bacterium]
MVTLTAACGARLSDAERAEAIATNRGGGSGTSSGEETADTTPSGATDGGTADPGLSSTTGGTA